MQEAETRKLELKRITAALRQLTPDQRKRVAVELAALDAQSASTVIVDGRFAWGATCPHCKTARRCERLPVPCKFTSAPHTAGGILICHHR